MKPTIVIILTALIVLSACQPKPALDIEGKKYISTELSECETIRYMCIEGTQAFTDDKGCGCEPIPAVPQGKLKSIDCTPDQRNAEICTLEYRPVCGWNNPEKIQCIKYPCASTYGNPCQACSNPNVISWTEGECPA